MLWKCSQNLLIYRKKLNWIECFYCRQKRGKWVGISTLTFSIVIKCTHIVRKPVKLVNPCCSLPKEIKDFTSNWKMDGSDLRVWRLRSIYGPPNVNYELLLFQNSATTRRWMKEWPHRAHLTRYTKQLTQFKVRRDTVGALIPLLPVIGSTHSKGLLMWRSPDKDMGY